MPRGITLHFLNFPPPHTHKDVKTTLLELHALGPTKLFDTAGIDEPGPLGEKKRAVSLAALKECDIGVLVIDVARHAAAAAAAAPALLSGGLQAGSAQAGTLAAAVESLRHALSWELLLLRSAAHYSVTPLLLLNLRGAPGTDAAAAAIRVRMSIVVPVFINLQD